MEVKVIFDRLPQIIDQLDDVLDAVVKKVTYDCEVIAKQKAPVDTGALRSSIQAKFPKKLTGEVAVGVDYGIYVEMGTRHARAQPYLAPAVREVEPEFRQAVEAALEKAAKNG